MGQKTASRYRLSQKKKLLDRSRAKSKLSFTRLFSLSLSFLTFFSIAWLGYIIFQYDYQSIKNQVWFQNFQENELGKKIFYGEFELPSFFKAAKNLVKEKEQKLSSIEAAPVEQLTEVKKVEFVVRSTPGGAQIFINNKSVGFTPKRVEVDSKKPFSLSLTKKDYITYERANIKPSKVASSISIPLYSVPVGSLTLDIHPDDNDVKVFINDKKVSRNFIKNYKLPVGVDIKIHVINSLGQEKTRIIQLKKNQVKHVIIQF